MPTLPTPPDAEFAKRFAGTYRYAFCMLFDGEVPADRDFGGQWGSKSTAFKNSEHDQVRQYVVLNLNPSNVSLREPFSTVVTQTQGGGKVVESRGIVLRQGSVTGTTGYLPERHKQRNPFTTVQRRNSLLPNDPALDDKLAAISGFKAFHDLRYLFRLYGYYRTKGRTDVTFHYFDFKNDDFWRIEPRSFDLSRSSRKPFSYDYSIAFDCLEPSDSILTVKLSAQDEVELPIKWKQPDKASGGIFASIKRLKAMADAGLQFVKHLSGATQRLFQSALSNVNAVVGFFENVYDTASILAHTPLTLIAQLDNSIEGVFRTIELYANVEAEGINIWRELNAWAVEAQMLDDQLADAISRVTAQFGGADATSMTQQFSTSRVKDGLVTDLMPPGETPSPDAYPFIGASGLELVTDVQKLVATKALTTAVVHDGDTIFSLAQRLLGDVNRFVDLVILNNLQHPYITAAGGPRLSNTLQWGDFILAPTSSRTLIDDSRPASSPSASGTVNQLGTSTELIDKPDLGEVQWRDNQWVGYTVTATTGSTVEQRVVVSNLYDRVVVNLPWTVALTLQTTYTITLQLFDAHRPVTAESRAYGRDLLVKFGTSGRAQLVLGARKDLATVRGIDNFNQAVALRLRTELTRHPFHKDYGIALPIGRPVAADTAVFYSYFVRRSLLLDPRVENVSNAQLTVEGDKFSYYAEVQPKNARQAQATRVTVG